MVIGLVVGGAVLLVGLAVAALTLVGTTEERQERSGPVGPHPSEGPVENPYVDPGGTPGLSDHWHAAFGIHVCGTWHPDPYDLGPDVSGIHTHDDGVIHIHPFSARYTGSQATLGVFFDMVGIEAGDEAVRVQGMDLTPRSGACGGTPGRWVLARFDPEASDQPPVQVVEDPAAFAEITFLLDRESITVAYLPVGEPVPPPPSVPMLDRLSDVPSGG